ncbi:MAG: hypothetical protein ACKOFH_15200, partial [Chthoniobacterales bacterium]
IKANRQVRKITLLRPLVDISKANAESGGAESGNYAGAWRLSAVGGWQRSGKFSAFSGSVFSRNSKETQNDECRMQNAKRETTSAADAERFFRPQDFSP